MSDQRHEKWSRVREDGAFDVVVVGGGINGIGVYRELALQGLRVLLVERNDFCSGCSSAPSRMIHGGLRYLENGELDLVRESLRERDALLGNAPHLVHPLPTVIPIHSTFSGLFNSAASFFGRSGKPSSRGAIPIKLGLSLYDWVSRTRRLLPRHAFLSARTTRTRWSKLTPGLKFSAIYHDAWISHPERLGIELIKDTEGEAPCCISLNYAEIETRENSLVVTCRRTGASVPVNARLIVNATGAWLDDTIAQITGDGQRDPLVSGTKGSHLIVDNPELEAALDGHMVYFENSDGRVCIAFPYFGKVLAGSTDIRVNSASRVRCEPEELHYILGSLRLVFPDIDLSPEQVVYSYAGIRPLPKSDHDYTGRISRGHSVKWLDGAVPQLCMVGGKWTTFRAFAEQAVDEVLFKLGKTRRQGTLARPIGGGKDFPSNAGDLEAALRSEYSIGAERARRMVATYGTLSRNVLEFCRKRPDDRQLSERTSMTAAEVACLIDTESVVTLSDIVLRRTTLAIDGTLSMNLISRLTDLMQQECGLPRHAAEQQRTALIEELNEFHGVSSEMLDTRDLNRSKTCA